MARNPLKNLNQIIEQNSLSAVPVFSPQPGRQTDFYKSSADILVYGGAAGSAKSFGLLLDFSKPDYLLNPGYRAAIFRRTYAELKNPGGGEKRAERKFQQMRLSKVFEWLGHPPSSS